MSYSVTKPTTETAKPTYVMLESLETQMYSGVVPVPVREPSKFRYRGPKMPLTLWQQVLHWFKTNSKGETMIRFFVDFETGTWHAIPFPQHYPTGMSVKEIEGHELTPDTGHLTQFGSAHHHCTLQAFPSGTDNQDEAKIEGLHLIVGNVDRQEMSIFLRLSVVLPGELRGNELVKPSRQVFIPEEMLELTDLFGDPVVDLLPISIRQPVIKMYLRQYLGQVVYPKAWDEMLLPPAPAQPPLWKPAGATSAYGVMPKYQSVPTVYQKVSDVKETKPKNKKYAYQSSNEVEDYALDEKERYQHKFYETLEEYYYSPYKAVKDEIHRVISYFYGDEIQEAPSIVADFSYHLTLDEMEEVLNQFAIDYDFMEN